LIFRIISILKAVFVINDEIYTDTEEMVRSFKGWIKKVPFFAGRLIIVIDAVNSLEDVDGCLQLLWLPTVLPENVKIIVSTTTDSPCYEAIHDKGWPIISMGSLSQDHRELITRKYLSLFAKSLSEAQLKKFVV